MELKELVLWGCLFVLTISMVICLIAVKCLVEKQMKLEKTEINKYKGKNIK